MMLDYLVIGAGLFGSVFAKKAADTGRKVLILDKNPYVGGNVYTENIDGILTHKFGPHLFHCKDKTVWDYVTKFAEFNHYQHKVKANYQGKIYSLPFNMMTYYQLWGTTTPKEAEEELKRQRVPIKRPSNLEEWALSQVGKDIYDKLIYGYTKKQWRREPRELPAFIIKRLPLRMTWNDNYFDDPYQGVPIKGFTHMVENILDHPNITVKLNEEFQGYKAWKRQANTLVYSGSIDQFFDYELGELEYRTIRFETKVHEGDRQGIGQMNYTDETTPYYTRVVEHKHFAFQKHKNTVVTYEYPETWDLSKPRYYPINDKKNNEVYQRYKEKAQQYKDIVISGRLGLNQYLDMNQVIAIALNTKLNSY